MSNITVKEFLGYIQEIFDENESDFLKAQHEPQIINYLVGKLMVKTKGQLNPSIGMTIIKLIVESDLPNNRKIVIN